MYINLSEKDWPEVEAREIENESRYFCKLCDSLLYSHGHYGNGPWPSEKKLEGRLGPKRGCCEKFK